MKNILEDMDQQIAEERDILKIQNTCPSKSMDHGIRNFVAISSIPEVGTTSEFGFV
jgi:hypothetical protein